MQAWQSSTIQKGEEKLAGLILRMSRHVLRISEVWLMCGRSIAVEIPCEVSLVGFLILEALIMVHQNADSQDRLSQET